MEELYARNGGHTSILTVSSGGLKGQSRRARSGVKYLAMVTATLVA